jgi:hypothetical protein
MTPSGESRVAGGVALSMLFIGSLPAGRGRLLGHQAADRRGVRRSLPVSIRIYGVSRRPKTP